MPSTKQYWWMPKRKSAKVFAVGYILAWLIILFLPVLIPFGKPYLIWGWIPGFNFWGTLAALLMFIFVIATYVMEKSEDQ